MLKNIKKIFPVLILLIYISSTIGLVISHIHCFCENNHQVKLFSLKEQSCSVCEAKEQQEQPKSCCAKKAHHPKEHKKCCENEVVYLKINADYNTVASVTILELKSFFNGIIEFIDPLNEDFVTTYKSTFLKEDIPKISGKDMVCYLHQFKFDAAIIS
jgi:hypothetical protein